VGETIQSTDFTALCLQATAVRKHYDHKAVSCKIDTTVYQTGWFNVVFQITFDDEVYWIARIQLPFTTEYDEVQQAVLKSEVDTMRYVKSHTNIPLPEVYDYNVNRLPELNPIGHPYTLMSAIDGQILPGQFRESVPQVYQDRVLSDIAGYLIELSTLRFPMIGRLDATINKGVSTYSIKPCINPAGCIWQQNSGPFHTAIDYFFTTRTIDYNQTLQRMSHDSDECFAAWLRLQTALAIVQMEFNQGPFPLHHPDLRFANILFDENYNITGIIDWSYTMAVPFEAFANLQSDFLQDDCFLAHLKSHEARIDPSTPFANYLSAKNSAWKATIPLQCLTGRKLHRMEIAGELLRFLFGNDVKWKTIKRTWMKSVLYTSPTRDPGRMGLGFQGLALTILGIAIALCSYSLVITSRRNPIY
jgi:aminoglycoside phosphotransferase (APT) family kinase protein